VSRSALVRKAVKRSAILFGIGLFMAAFPIVQIDPTFEWLRPGLGELRIMGILQRIALCYLAASVLFLYARPRIRTYWMGGILLAYWGALTLVPVPGHGAGMLDVPEATLPAYVDRLVLGTEHLWAGADQMWDPEGLLSTLPAIVTTTSRLPSEMWRACLCGKRQRPLWKVEPATAGILERHLLNSP
jgi:predicted acyltransferase